MPCEVWGRSQYLLLLRLLLTCPTCTLKARLHMVKLRVVVGRPGQPKGMPIGPAPLMEQCRVAGKADIVAKSK